MSARINAPHEARYREPKANRYPGRCPECQGWVEAGMGILVRTGSGWGAQHPLGSCPQPQAPRSQGNAWTQRNGGLPAQPRRQERRQPAEPGLYRKDGKLYAVRVFTPRGEKEQVRYARELAANEAGNLDRVNENGDAVKLHSIKAPRMQWELRPEHAVSLEEAKALNVRFGECVICGTPIEAKESVEDRAGIGPVCWDRQVALNEARAGA